MCRLFEILNVMNPGNYKKVRNVQSEREREVLQVGRSSSTWRYPYKASRIGRLVHREPPVHPLSVRSYSPRSHNWSNACVTPSCNGRTSSSIY